jgi:ribosomal protein L37AE/L43A
VKSASWLFDKVIAPLLVIVLAPAATALGSLVLTGNWTLWFRQYPIPIAVATTGLLIVAAILLARRREPTPTSYLMMVGGGGYRWQKIGNIEHAGVLWEVGAPGLWRRSELPSLIDVALPPRCPACKTELEETRLMWGFHLWKCIRCGFRKRSKESYYTEQERARKIAKVRAEEDLEEQ